MKLKMNGFENEINFEDGVINVLTIKDTKFFTHFLELINNEINEIESEEIFLLDDNEQMLKFYKECYLLCDVFNVDYNSKKTLNKLYKIISENIALSEEYEINDLEIKLRNKIIEEINELPFEFTMNTEIDINDLLKLFDLKIDDSSCKNVLERLEILISLISTLKLAKILIIPNLKLFLSEKDLLELYKYSLYNNVKLFLIERNDAINLKYEKTYVIDENFNDYIL